MSATASASRGTTTRRVVGRCVGTDPGAPLLVCIGALHGNEPAGVEAARRVIERLHADSSNLLGELVGLVGNTRALAAGRRFLALDLNRAWIPERVQRARSHPGDSPEEREIAELASELEIVLASADKRPVFVLDLHTTSGPSPAFGILDDTLANRRFALALPVPVVVGLEEELEGTLLNYLESFAVTTAGFEAGQHHDPFSVARAEAAIWIALEAAGTLLPDRPEVAAARDLLADDSRGLPHVVEVRSRHRIRPGDAFQMVPGMVSFERIAAGQQLAVDRRGAVRAGSSGLILMPLYQSQGEDGFFLVREISPLWLKLSEVLRGLRAERWLHLLPGVRRHSERPHVYLVDRRVARWYALEILHLLGFRRHGEDGRFLTVARRS